jgi:3-deoxy-D-manno-octulosonic-acid transferase
VFVGGSLIPHGGQSIFEPAAAGKAIVTGPHTANFADAVSGFLASDALIQLPVLRPDDVVPRLVEELSELLQNVDRRSEFGERAQAFVNESRGAAARTAEYLAGLVPAGHLR